MDQPTTNVPVQLVLYTSQVELLNAAVSYALAADEKMPKHIENGLWDLNTFLEAVRSDPRSWPVEGGMARSLKVRARRMKGPREKPKPMGREARRKRRKEEAKARRVNRQDSVAQFNLDAAIRREAEAGPVPPGEVHSGDGGRRGSLARRVVGLDRLRKGSGSEPTEG